MPDTTDSDVNYSTEIFNSHNPQTVFYEHEAELPKTQGTYGIRWQVCPNPTPV